MGSKIFLPQNFEKYRHGGVFSQIGAFKGEDFSDFKFSRIPFSYFSVPT